MYKTILAHASASVLFVYAGAGAHAAGIWQESDADLPALIANDFAVVNTSFTLSPSMDQSVEVIYLAKGRRFFRCTTLEIRNQEQRHWCETLE